MLREASDLPEFERWFNALRLRLPALLIVAPQPIQPTSMPDLIEAMLPAEIPPAAETLQARRNAEARWRLFSEFGVLTSAEVAEAAGSRATNTSETSSRWLRRGDITSVTHRGTRYFPAFQFDDEGKPLPIVKPILRALDGYGEWERAIWFITRTLRLNDQRPVDLLRERPSDVLEAAAAMSEPVG